MLQNMIYSSPVTLLWNFCVSAMFLHVTQHLFLHSLPCSIPILYVEIAALTIRSFKFLGVPKATTGGFRKHLHNFGCLGAFVLTVNGLYYPIKHQVVCNNKGDWLDHFAIDCNQGVIL